MKPFVSLIVAGSLLALCLGIRPLVSVAQTPGSDSPHLSSTAAEVDAEREKIWNSPEMLAARAHMELTFQRSAQITDEQAAQYMADLKALSPEQMRIWLLQHQAQRAQVQQEEARWANLRRDAARGNLPAQNVGGFRNPVATRSNVSSGRPVTSVPTPQRPQPVQKPFSGSQYARALTPLISSEDVARAEILRSFSPWFVY